MDWKKSWNNFVAKLRFVVYTIKRNFLWKINLNWKMWCMIILFLGQSIAVNHVYSLSIPGNGRGCDPSCWSRATSISNFIWVTGATKSCIFTLAIYSLVLIYQKKLRQRWSKTKLLILFSHDKKRLSDLEHTFGNSQNFCWFSENFVSWLYLFDYLNLGHQLNCPEDIVMTVC